MPATEGKGKEIIDDIYSKWGLIGKEGGEEVEKGEEGREQGREGGRMGGVHNMSKVVKR